MVLELVWLVLGLREVLATMALTTSFTINTTTNSNNSISSIVLLALRGAPGVSKVLRWSYKAAFTVFCLSYCVPRKTHVTKSTCVPAKRRFAPSWSLWDENKIFGAMVSILPCKLCHVQCKMCFGQQCGVDLIWIFKKRSAQFSKNLLGLSSIRGQRKLFQWKKPNDFPADFRKMFPKTLLIFFSRRSQKYWPCLTNFNQY